MRTIIVYIFILTGLLMLQCAKVELVDRIVQNIVNVTDHSVEMQVFRNGTISDNYQIEPRKQLTLKYSPDIGDYKPLLDPIMVKWIFDKSRQRVDNKYCKGDSIEILQCKTNVNILRVESHVIKLLDENSHEWTFYITDSMYLATKPIK